MKSRRLASKEILLQSNNFSMDTCKVNIISADQANPRYALEKEKNQLSLHRDISKRINLIFI